MCHPSSALVKLGSSKVMNLVIPDPLLEAQKLASLSPPVEINSPCKGADLEVSCQITVGPLSVSPMGLGTWAWGNKFLWGYDESMDIELQDVFNLAVNTGINLFDTADSYGTGRLNGRSELLLGNFIRDYSGSERRRRNIHIATKFAAYPWRLTSRQLVNACK
ncbi:hypothetical protein L7F22_022996 [Adiantum nelumboides]|nr:hypothetical protein [Adiantum nelumboides]